MGFAEGTYKDNNGKTIDRFNYDEVTGEVVDELQNHQDLINEINEANNGEDALTSETFTKMKKQQLGNYILSFVKNGEGGARTYNEMKNISDNKNMSFALRAAIWRLTEGALADKKFDDNGNIIDDSQIVDSEDSESTEAITGKTAEEILIMNGGVNTEVLPSSLVRILQYFVGAKVDGLFGPETAYRTAAKLGAKDTALKDAISGHGTDLGDDSVEGYYGDIDIDAVKEFDEKTFGDYKISLGNGVEGTFTNANNFTVKCGADSFVYYLGSDGSLKVLDNKTPSETVFEIQYLDANGNIANQPTKNIRITSVEQQNKKDSIDLGNGNIYYYDKDVLQVIPSGWMGYNILKSGDIEEEVKDINNLKYFVIKDNVIRLKTNKEVLVAERQEQLEKLNSISMRGHKLAYKINGEWKYCAYDNGTGSRDYDYISIYDNDKQKVTSRRRNQFTNKVYDVIDVYGANYQTNLVNESYKSINNVRNNRYEKESDKAWAIKEYTSKGAWTDGSKGALYDWCKTRAESTNGYGYKGGDFLTFCEKVSKKCNIDVNKFTVGVWMSMMELSVNADSIENIAIK